MEFLGKIVRKEFKGFGVFEGVVESYDSSTGFFRILYEDGDSEEVDVSEVVRLVSSATAADPITENLKRVGRKPKRRRRNCLDPGKSSDNLVIDNLQQNIVIEHGLVQTVVKNDFNVFIAGNDKLDNFVGGGDGGLDLNRGFDFYDGVENVEIRGCIDLNVSVDVDEFDENDSRVCKEGLIGGVEGEKKEREFDLNLGLNDETMNGINGILPTDACGGLGEELKIGDDVAHQSSPMSVVELEGNDVIRVCDVQLEGSCSNAVALTPCEDGNSVRRKKRRKVERNLNSPTGTVLRRSARRAKAVALNENITSTAMAEDGVNDLSVSGVTDESEEKPVAGDLARQVEPEALPSKIELPPSSTNLNLDGIPVVDIFSVYTCLRSFSTLLYLSPFGIEDFVAALKSKVSNLLIDSSHVSILQALRKHLEFLAKEGCESASACLRNLNWDLLDVITWPIFMVEYLLIHGSGLKPGFSLNRLKLFDGEYYKQPAEVKIELLRCLCDDVVEVESIRSELSRRTDFNMEVGQAMSNDLNRKRRISSDAHVDSYLSEDVKEEAADGNSDECCLCKMDGNLICCDGCPAAYHSKCVGIISSLLPEGDWYCPECMIGRLNFGNKPQKLIRGAELLGIDPYGRLFFSCFNYLLVSDSYDAEASFSYYHKDDLSAVIQFLSSSYILYGSILSAICRHWAIPAGLCQPKNGMESEYCLLRDGAPDGRKTKSSIFPGNSGCLGSEISHPASLFGSDTVKHCTETENLLTSSEGSGEVLQGNGSIQESGNTISASKQRKKKCYSVGHRRPSLLKAKEEDILQGLSGDGYVNHYSFAQTASSVVEELLRKPSDKVNVGIPETEEEIISIQLKFILKNSKKFCWTTIQDVNGERQKEKCGWCYCCRFPVEDRGCLCNVKNSTSIPETLKAEIDGILSKKKKKGHLVDVICYVLTMEERLRGLLLGPWLSPQYSELWRQRVLKASDVSSLKRPLLMLESSLHPLTLSVDWSKHVDSVTTMGSASHFVASSRVTSKNGTSRKRGKYADSETKSSTAGRGLSLFWWRGGKTSRSLFSWKVVPHSLALKAARKAGCMKIPDIQYPDTSENARRSKYVAWRAAVETSTSLEQLALQVRELDLFIRWDDIENTHPHTLLDKDSIKSIRLFKKVIIRRKCIEGTAARYLLDFGKRRSIPEVVLKHGVKLEDSTCERKKYWLDEPYVPLYLLKSFEERRIIRKAGKMNSSKFRKGGRVMKKPLREKGFDYLFTRAEMADSYRCGHCNKSVSISEAVTCQICDGFFHKRHVMKSSEGITAGHTYTCHRCRLKKDSSSLGKRKLGRLRDAKNLKVDSERNSPMLRAKPRKNRTIVKRRQVPLRNNKKMQYDERPLSRKNANVSAGITLRRSARKAKCISLQSNRFAGSKKKKRNKPRKVASKEAPKCSSWQKRRTRNLHCFWLNGLLFSRKPNDERVVQFKRRKLLVPSEFSAGIDDQPKCSLCSQQGPSSAVIYIACEICGDWFHGDAFGLNKGNVESLVGFKCHVCRARIPPLCPFVDISRDNVSFFVESTNEAQDAYGLPEAVVVQKETDCLPEFQCNEGSSGQLEVERANDSDGKLDHDKTPLLDSELRVENSSFTGKVVISNSIESQDGLLETNLAAKSDENSVLEGNMIKLNESPLTPLTEGQSCTSVLDGMNSKNSEFAEG